MVTLVRGSQNYSYGVSWQINYKFKMSMFLNNIIIILIKVTEHFMEQFVFISLYLVTHLL